MSWWAPWRRRSAPAETITPAQLDPAALAGLRELDSDEEPDWSANFMADFSGRLVTGLVQMRAAVREGNAAEVSSQAHRLKSVSRQVGAIELADQLLALERGSADGTSLPGSEVLDALDAEAQRVRLAIEVALAGE